MVVTEAEGLSQDEVVVKGLATKPKGLTFDLQLVTLALSEAEGWNLKPTFHLPPTSTS